LKHFFRFATGHFQARFQLVEGVRVNDISETRQRFRPNLLAETAYRICLFFVNNLFRFYSKLFLNLFNTSHTFRYFSQYDLY